MSIGEFGGWAFLVLGGFAVLAALVGALAVYWVSSREWP